MFQSAWRTNLSKISPFDVIGKRVQETISIVVTLILIVVDLGFLVYFFIPNYFGSILLAGLAGIFSADFSSGMVFTMLFFSMILCYIFSLLLQVALGGRYMGIRRPPVSWKSFNKVV